MAATKSGGGDAAGSGPLVHAPTLELLKGGGDGGLDVYPGTPSTVATPVRARGFSPGAASMCSNSSWSSGLTPAGNTQLRGLRIPMPKQSGDDLDDKDRISARVGGGPGARALLIVRLPIFCFGFDEFFPHGTLHRYPRRILFNGSSSSVYIYKILMALVS